MSLWLSRYWKLLALPLPVKRSNSRPGASGSSAGTPLRGAANGPATWRGAGEAESEGGFVIEYLDEYVYICILYIYIGSLLHDPPLGCLPLHMLLATSVPCIYSKAKNRKCQCFRT